MKYYKLKFSVSQGISIMELQYTGTVDYGGKELLKLRNEQGYGVDIIETELMKIKCDDLLKEEQFSLVFEKSDAKKAKQIFKDEIAKFLKRKRKKVKTRMEEVENF